MCLDQIVLECWENSVSHFPTTSHSVAENQKCANALFFYITALSEFYCGDDFKWEWQDNFVSDGCKIKIDEDLYDYYKDQGHVENDDDMPVDDVMNTECDDEYNPDDFDFEVNDDSDDSDF